MSDAVKMAAPTINKLRLGSTFSKLRYILSCQPARYYGSRRKFGKTDENLYGDPLYEKGMSMKDRYVGVKKSEEVHPETPVKGQYEVNPPKGAIFDKKPFPIELMAGKKYFWCTCGHSKTQPLCDGTHKDLYRVMSQKVPLAAVKFLPHAFRVEETKQYWLCNCKQTEDRPFCDGTHKREDIQKKIKK